MVLGSIALLAMGVALYYALLNPRTVVVRKDDALEAAQRRFARGEITAEEFEEIKRRLRE